MKNEGKIRVELDKKVEDIVTKDDRVAVIESSDKLLLEVDVKGANGATISAEFKLKQENELNASTNLKLDKINKQT